MVGLGGFLCFFTGGFVNKITGNILQATGGYVSVFSISPGCTRLAARHPVVGTKIGKEECR